MQINLKINQIVPDQKIREHTDSLDSLRAIPERWARLLVLANDIDENGLISPITVREKDGQYILFDGHRRWLAVQLLIEMGRYTLDTIPAFVIKDMETNFDVMMGQLATDYTKESYNVFEVARGLESALAYLKANGGVITYIENGEKVEQAIEAKSNEELIWDLLEKKMGISRSRRYQIIATLNLDEEAKMVAERGGLTEGRVRYLLPVKSPSRQRELVNYIIKESPSNADLRKKSKEVEGEDKDIGYPIPKPARILSHLSGVFQLHKEFSQAKNILAQIVRKDPRTVDSYVKAIAEMDRAIKELEEVRKMFIGIDDFLNDE